MARIPSFMYGTAWKEHSTEGLVAHAIDAGFRAFDTANQRKHYFEAGVGDALALAMESGKVTREDLFLQTKFTYLRGQDHRLPYDKEAEYAVQVRQSFEKSLEHLRLDALDSFVLHGPYSGWGISEEDKQVWQEMERIQQEGGTKFLGVSNVTIEQLQDLYKVAAVKPLFVQNRCYAQTGWDSEVRQFCKKNNMVYQGFSLLTANPFVLRDTMVQAIAARRRMTPAQVVFCFAIQRGMLPLTGTSDESHMKQDLECLEIKIDAEELDYVERVGTGPATQ